MPLAGAIQIIRIIIMGMHLVQIAKPFIKPFFPGTPDEPSSPSPHFPIAAVT